MTVLLFRDDAYLRGAEAQVVAVAEDGAVALDRTVFYAQGGGQPGDTGRLHAGDGRVATVAETVYAPDRATVLHRLGPGAGSFAVGDRVTAALDWETRWARMRVHTALHLLSVVLAFPVTGGSIGDGEGRLDFDMPADAADRAGAEDRLNALVEADLPVTTEWITDAELDANPGLVRTLSVKPPRGSGRVRLVRIGSVDLQPCGGTHVRRTGEIGRVALTGIEKKGRQNRRVRIALA